jgi:hypothetical protein
LWQGGEQASREAGQKTDSRSGGEREEAQNTSSFSTTLLAGSGLMFYCALPLPFSPLGLFERDFSQSNAFDRCPDDGQATHLGREHIDLVSPLAHVAEETLDGIGGLDGAMHRLRKVVKRQRLVFLLR